MNVKYDFTQEGGIPIDQNVFNDLQNGILEAEGAIAALVGTLVIISGCVVTGGNVGNGIVAINGAVMPFIGGAVGTKVIVQQPTTPLTYFDGSTPASLITQYATFGDDGVQNNLWTNFTQLPAGALVAAVNSLEGDIATLGAEITSLEASVVTLESEVTTLQNGWAKKLGSGTVNVGDIPAGGQQFAVNFGAALPTANYMVLYEVFLNPGAGAPSANEVRCVTTVSKTVNGFIFFLDEPGSMTQNLSVNYLLIAL